MPGAPCQPAYHHQRGDGWLLAPGSGILELTVHVGGDFIVGQGDGDSDIELENVQVAHLLKIATEGGSDNVDLEDVTADRLWIDTGSGDDAVTLEGDGGPGNHFRTAQVYLGPGQVDGRRH